MMQVKKLDYMSMGKTGGVVGVIVGFVLGAIAFIGLSALGGPIVGGAFGVVGFFYNLINGLVEGVVGGVVFALLYNVLYRSVFSKIGGIMAN